MRPSTSGPTATTRLEPTDERADAAPLLLIVAGLLRASAAFALAVVRTVLDAPLDTDPQHLQPPILTRSPSD